MDNFTNWAVFEVAGTYDAAATAVALTADPGAKCPVAPANAWWWDAKTYARPQDDPKAEIVRMTARAGAILTITRAQEGTAAQTKNTAGKSYKIAFGPTAKTFNTDIPAAIAAAVATPAEANHRTRANTLEIYNTEQQKWFPITCEGPAGVEQLVIGVGNNNP